MSGAPLWGPSDPSTWVEKPCVQRHRGDVANTSIKKYSGAR